MAPRQHSFDEGLSRLITLLLRLLLPLAVFVLTIFVFFIPANFWELFENRDVLIAFNALLFAVIALLVGVVRWRVGISMSGCGLGSGAGFWRYGKF